MNKNAIVVLTRGYENPIYYKNLIFRNKQIEEKITNKTNKSFDVLIFHEGNIIKEHQKLISDVTPKLKLNFIDVKKTTPKTAFDNSKNKINMELCPPTLQSNSFPLGYKHMCHFWSIDFLDYLKDYKFIIRIDEDCFIKNFDLGILDEMEKNKILFVSPEFQQQDDWFVIVGLEKLWNEFIEEKKITPFKSFQEVTCPYTNLMIVDIENIRNNDIINEFLKKIDSSHGIYSNRWGDLPIWGLILSTMVDSKYYSEIKSISYFHQSHNKNVN
jgi:hypothetical protein